jgi:hypothetical protein
MAVLILTLACVLLAPFALRRYLDHKRRAKPFPLMKLSVPPYPADQLHPLYATPFPTANPPPRPPEVRSMVLDHLVTHDIHATAAALAAARRAPPHPRWRGARHADGRAALRRTLSPVLRPLLARLFPAVTADAPQAVYPALTLASSGLRAEFLHRFAARAEFRFALDAARPDTGALWDLTREARALLRRVHVTVLVNPGSSTPGPTAAPNGPATEEVERRQQQPQEPFAFDPRSPPADAASWALPGKVHGALAAMPRLEGARVTVRAAGNQLWNPLWLWHYGSQAFKRLPLAGADGKAPLLRRIDFALDADVKGWLVQELNHLERGRGPGDGWEWRCRKGHLVAADEAGAMPIRRFCTMLYRECGVCEPAAAADAGDDDP